jgi:hypothetical protein
MTSQPQSAPQIAAPTPSAPLNRAPLDRIARAVQRQQLAGADLADLRAHIALLVDLETEHRVVRAGLRNLRVADTQLKDIQAHNFGPILDETAFATLPKHLRRRVLLRLSNIAGRMDRECCPPNSQHRQHRRTMTSTPRSDACAIAGPAKPWLTPRRSGVSCRWWCACSGPFYRFCSRDGPPQATGGCNELQRVRWIKPSVVQRPTRNCALQQAAFRAD